MYAVATISRLLKIIGLFCKRALYICVYVRWSLIIAICAQRCTLACNAENTYVFVHMCITCMYTCMMVTHHRDYRLQVSFAEY